MKRFTWRLLEEAIQYSVDGEQALHTHRFIGDYGKAPRCFVEAVEKGEDIAHLFDQDEIRLIATARKLGVRVILVERQGTSNQHIDLCGAPLRKAIAMCEADVLNSQEPESGKK